MSSSDEGESFLGARLLGLDGVQRDVWPVLLRGLEASVVSRLARHLEVTEAQLLELVGVSHGGYRRYVQGWQRLGPRDSESLYNLARVLEAAEGTFQGDIDLARTWLRQPRSALEGLAPHEAAGTSVGAERVLRLLTRLEHGVFD